MKRKHDHMKKISEIYQQIILNAIFLAEGKINDAYECLSAIENYLKDSEMFGVKKINWKDLLKECMLDH